MANVDLSLVQSQATMNGQPEETKRAVIHHREELITSVYTGMISIANNLINAYVEIKKSNNATLVTLAQIDASVREQQEETLRERIRQEENTKQVLEQYRIELEKEKLKYSQLAFEASNKRREIEMQHSQWQYKVAPLNKHMNFLMTAYEEAWAHYRQSGFEDTKMVDVLQRLDSMIRSCSEQMQKI